MVTDIELRRKQIKKELDELNKVPTFKFFQLVTKITVTKHSNSEFIKQISEYGTYADLMFK